MIPSILSLCSKAMVTGFVQIEINVMVEKRDVETGSSFVIKIKDNGPGIPEENLSEIFEAFYSTKPTTGTGLGLGVVRRLVQLYDGSIEVESEIDSGAKFTVKIYPSAFGCYLSVDQHAAGECQSIQRQNNNRSFFGCDGRRRHTVSGR